MTASLNENVVDMVPNYDNTLMQPEVLPAAIPNLLVNGSAGIAVGMATNMPPHNLGEVIAGARHLLFHPEAALDEIMRFIPGPDLPEGGKIVGLTGIKQAYETGRGIFKTRATAHIENVTARKKGIVFTELPYLTGPEKIIEKIKDGVQSKKLQGISGVQNLTDRHHGMRLVVEVKTLSTRKLCLRRFINIRRLKNRLESIMLHLLPGSRAHSDYYNYCRYILITG
ncbi:DNA gyrase subunit A [Arcanobacterium hippocoleae]